MTNRTTKMQLKAVTFVFATMLPSLLGAQEDQTDNSTIVYPADYFAESLPVSANDMVNRIPGIGLALRGGSSGRGLGSGEGEILINGQRVTGKSNGARTQLSRISADQVDYIEIIRGTSEELDVRGGGQVVNVVLIDTPSRSSISAEANMDKFSDGTYDPGGKLSYSAQTGNFNYLLHIEAESNYYTQYATEISYDPDFNIQEIREEKNSNDRAEYQTSVNMGYAFNKSIVQFNALYATSTPDSGLERSIQDTINNSVEFEREISGGERSNWEIGGDYEYAFNNGGKYRFLFIVNDRDYIFARERYDVLADSEVLNRFLENQGRDRERIARTSYTWNFSAAQGMEVGVERAETIRDSGLRLGLDTEGVASPDYGGLVPVTIGNSGSTVEELRYETFAAHNWQFNPKMSLASSLIFETSTITQSGDVNNDRDFEFVRPKVDFRYDITPFLQLRAGIEKDVSQLSFSDFSASVDNSDEDANTQAGNPDIAQEQSWRYELNLELRLPNNIGVFNSQFYYRDMEDVIDRIDISTGPDDLHSARGNIGDGKRYGVNFDLSARLGFIGLPSALLTTSVSLRDSEVIDPFLGTPRRMRNHSRWSNRVGFRHDVSSLGLSYGFNYSQSANGGSGRSEIDIIDIERRKFQPNLSAFIEKKAFGNITFRLDAQDIREREFCRTRTRFIGATVDGIVEEIEDYCSSNGLKLVLKARTTF